MCRDEAENKDKLGFKDNSVAGETVGVRREIGCNKRWVQERIFERWVRADFFFLFDRGEENPEDWSQQGKIEPDSGGG